MSIRQAQRDKAAIWVPSNGACHRPPFGLACGKGLSRWTWIRSYVPAELGFSPWCACTYCESDSLSALSVLEWPVQFGICAGGTFSATAVRELPSAWAVSAHRVRSSSSWDACSHWVCGFARAPPFHDRGPLWPSAVVPIGVPASSSCFLCHNGATSFGCLDNPVEMVLCKDWRLRSKSVAQGCSPVLLLQGPAASNEHLWKHAWETCLSVLLAFFRTALGVLLLTLVRLLLWQLGRDCSRLAFRACLPLRAAPLGIIRVLGGVASDFRTEACLTWDSKSHRRGARQRAKGPSCARVFWFWFWLLGGSLPQVVFAAPITAVRIAAAVEAWCEGLPQPLPPPFSSEADRSAGSNDLLPDAEDNSPVSGGVDIRCVIFEVGQGAEAVEVRIAERATCESLAQAVDAMLLPPAFPRRLVPAVPAFGQGYVPFVAVHDWVSAASKTVFVINLEALQGPIFAVCDWEFVSFRTLEIIAERFTLKNWKVLFGNSLTPLAPGDSVLAFAGVVFTFLPAEAEVAAVRPIEERLQDPAAWQSASTELLYRDRVSDYWLLLCSHVTRLIPYAGPDFAAVRALVADAIPAFADEILVSDVPLASPLMRINCDGLIVRGVLAATPKPHDTPSANVSGVFVLVDIRTLGRRPAMVFVQTGWNAIEDLAGEVGLQPPKGFLMQVLGVPVKGLTFLVAESCTISVGYVPENRGDALAAPSPSPRQYRRPLREQHVILAARRENAELEEAPTPDVLTHNEEPAVRIPIRARPDDPPPPEFIHGGFVVLSVRYKPEILHLFLRAPCDIDTALQEVDEARDAARVELCGTLIVAEPQPDPAFAVLLAVPDWAGTQRCVVVGARQIDGRLFSWILPEFMSREALILELGVPNLPGLRVFLSGRPLSQHEAHRPRRMWQGATVSFVPAGGALSRMSTLTHMLASTRGWHMPCPYFGGRTGTSLLVLSDTDRQVVDIDVNIVQSTADFKRVAVALFNYSLHLLTVCPSTPRLDDVSELGQDCHAIVAATERVPRIPIPPGRWQPSQHLVFLDRRPLLQSCTWFLARAGRICYDSLISPYSATAPVGFVVEVRGGGALHDRDSPYLIVPHGTILELSYVSEAFLNTPTDGSDVDMSGEDPESESSSDSDPGEASHSPAEDRQGGDGRRSRSRSPRTGGATDSAAGSEVHATGLGLAALLFPVTADAAATDWRAWEQGSTGSVGEGCVALFVCLALVLCGSILCCAFIRLAASHGRLPLCWHKTVGRRGTSQCRELPEPHGRTPEEQQALDMLRSQTRALGGPWRTRVPVFAQAFVQPVIEVDAATADGFTFERRLSCVVLKLDFSPEYAVVTLSLPATQEELVEQLQLERSSHCRDHYPLLLPVLPQPCIGTAVFLALPEWRGHAGVCFDTSRFDNRVFLAFPPPYVTRADLVRLADLPAGVSPSVWVGLDGQCLEDDVLTHLPPGIVIWFLPDDESPPMPHTLGQLLLSRDLWSADSVVPVPDVAGAVCLVHRDRCSLHFSASPVSGRYRQAIADAVSISSRSMRLYAASPRPRDAASNGVPCEAVIAVDEGCALEQRAVWFLALLDCRHLEKGWRGLLVRDGRIDVREVLQELQAGAPPGWEVGFRDANTSHDMLSAGPGPGQVFVVIFRPAGNAEVPTNPASAGAQASAALGSDDTNGLGRVEEEAEEGAFVDDMPGVSSAQEEQGQPAHFLLFSPEYQAEAVQVRLRFPASIDEVFSRVNEVRDVDRGRWFPQLIVVPSQPPIPFACLLALPAWPFDGIPVLFACYVPPTRYFAAVVPAVLSVEEIARVACVPSWVPVRVIVSAVPWAFPAGERINVAAGDLIAVYVEDQYWFPPLAFRDFLNSGDGWPADPTPPGPGAEGDWLLTDQTGLSFIRPPPQIAPLPVVIAALWRIDEADLTFQPSIPMIRDHARGGFPSGRVFLALRLAAEENVPFILDLRPTLLALEWMWAPRGRVDVASVCARLASHCPLGYFIRLLGGRALPGMENHERIVFPGQVLQVEFWPRRGSGWQSADDGDGTHPDEMPDGDGDNEEDPEDQGTPLESVSSQPDAGTGSTQRRVRPVHAWQAARRHDGAFVVSSPGVKWGRIPRQDAFHEGRSVLTSDASLSCIVPSDDTCNALCWRCTIAVLLCYVAAVGL